MKNILKLYLLLIAVGWTSVGFGQTSALTCNTVGLTTNDVMCDTYANMNWNWESPECKYWYYKQNSNTMFSLPHPFYSKAQSKRVSEIVLMGDYKKANGWVLINREFGCTNSSANTPLNFPYFILYNKYTGLLRMFVNAPKLTTDYYIFKLSPSVKSTAVSSSSPLNCPDKYLNSTPSEEALFYYQPQSAGGNWIVGEFTLGFDPNIKNAVFKGSQLQIELLTVTQQTISATIKGTSNTYDDRTISGVNFSTSVDPTTNKIKTAGKKILEYSKSGGDALTKMHDDFEKDANKVNGWAATNPSLKPYAQKLRSLQVITDPSFGGIGKPVAQFFNATKNIGEAFGIVGDALNIVDFIGDFTGWWNMFDSGTSGPSITPPTTTNYNLELEGKISSNPQLNTVAKFTIPGIDNPIVPNNDYPSYYNSPTGIFNLQTTPTAQRVIYNRYVATTIKNIRKYQSLKINNNLNPIINTCSDLKFEGMIAAVYITFDNNPLEDNPGSNTNLNYGEFIRQFAANQYEIVKYDKENKNFIFRTKYYDYRTLKDLAINVPYDSVRITLKTIATFTKTGENKPIVFSKEYGIDFIDQASDYNYDIWYSVYPNDISQHFIAPYPFSNGESPPSRFINGGTISTIKSITLPSGWPSIACEYSIYGYPNLVSDLDLGYTNNLIIFDKKFIANNSISITNTSDCFGLNKGVDLKPGCELVVSNGYNRVDVIDNSIAPVYTNFACNNYSTNAQRNGIVEDVELEKTTIAPNPFEESFLLNLAKYAGESKTVSVFSQFGNEVKSFLVDSETNNISINMKDLSSGLYLVKIENNSISETIKVIKQ